MCQIIEKCHLYINLSPNQHHLIQLHQSNNYFACVRALNIDVREKKNCEKCQNNEKVSPKWLCLPMAINLGNLGNWNISATCFRPEVSLKGVPYFILNLCATSMVISKPSVHTTIKTMDIFLFPNFFFPLSVASRVEGCNTGRYICLPHPGQAAAFLCKIFSV